MIYKNRYKPLKDLKGSSVWKGSVGASLTLLLLNMAIFDLKESPWSINKKKNLNEHNLCFHSPNRLNKHGRLRTTTISSKYSWSLQDDKK